MTELAARKPSVLHNIYGRSSHRDFVPTAAAFVNNNDETLADKNSEDEGFSNLKLNNNCIIPSDARQSATAGALFVSTQSFPGLLPPTFATPVPPGESDLATDSGCDTTTPAGTAPSAASSDAGSENSGSPSMLCGTCGVLIRNSANLAVHMRRHLQYRPYSCSKCKYSGYDDNDVKRHIARAHHATATSDSSDSAQTRPSASVQYKPQMDMESSVGELIQNSRLFSPSGSDNTTTTYEPNGGNRSSSAVATTDESPSAKRPNMEGSSEKSDGYDFLKCQFCGQSVLHSPVKIVQHLKAHFTFLGYPCSLCTSALSTQCSEPPDGATPRITRHFSSVAELTDHLEQSHKDEPTCRIVSQQAIETLPRELTAMVELAFSESPVGSTSSPVSPQLKCNLCAVRIPWTMVSVWRHAEEHGGYYPYQCTYCKSPFLDQPSLVSHIKGSHPRALVVVSYQPNYSESLALLSTLQKCFPCLSAEFIENAHSDSRGGSFIGTTAYVVPTAPEVQQAVSMDVKSTSGWSSAVDNAPAKPETVRSQHNVNMSSLGGTDGAPGEHMKCNACSSQVARSVSSLVAHTKSHLGYRPLRCGYCPFRHHTKLKMEQHVARAHRGQPFTYTHHPVPEIARQIKEMLEGCFGATIGASLSVADIEHLICEEETTSSQIAVSGQMGKGAPGKADITPGLSSAALMDGNGGIAASSAGDLLRSLVSAQLEQYSLDAGKALADLDSSGFTHIKSSLNNLRMNAPSLVMGAASSSGPFGQSSVNNSVTGTLAGSPSDTFLASVGKKICQLCSTYIANNPSSFENHACKHLDYKPFHCHYCQYQSYIRGKVTRHIQQVHHGLPIRINHEPIPGIKEQISVLKAACFPFLAGTSALSSSANSPAGDSELNHSPDKGLPCRGDLPQKGGEYTCRVCDNRIGADQTSIDEHLKKHTAVKVYHCPVCSFKNAQMLATKQHVNSAHSDQKVTRILCCPPDGPAGLEKLRIRCFGPRHEENANSAGVTVTSAAPSPLGQPNITSDRSSPATALLAANIARAGGSLTGIRLFPPVSSEQTGAASNMDFEDDSCGEQNDSFYGGLDGSDETANDSLLVDEEDSNESRRTDLSRSPTGMDGQLQQALVTSDQQAACTLCGDLVPASQAFISAHVRKHLDYKPYQCSYCSWKSTEQIDVKQHITASHPESPLKVLYHPERMQLTRWQQKCFPTLSPLNYGSGGQSQFLSVPGTSSSAGFSTVNSPHNYGSAVRKLVCHVCNQSIADNPKSVGIHVKNHLGYRPYRCPDCNYSSCEQSKARRHIEHVHGRKGEELRVEQRMEETALKERIADMKSQCFPNLGHVGIGEVYANTEEAALFDGNMGRAVDVDSTQQQLSHVQKPGPDKEEKRELSPVAREHECTVCRQVIPSESVDYHVRTHLGKPFKCGYCGARFWTQEKVEIHHNAIHAGFPPNFLYQGNHADPTAQFHQVKQHCFPTLPGDPMENTTVDDVISMVSGAAAAVPNAPSTSSHEENRVLANLIANMYKPPAVIRSLVGIQEPAKVACVICDQIVAANSNSMEVHVKNHLNYKPYQCGYCDYRSCIPGKVKRHLDTVHRGMETKSYNSSQSSPTLKAIIQELKMTCFPTQFAEVLPTTDSGGLSGGSKSKTKSQLLDHLDALKKRMQDELQVLSMQQRQDGSTKDPSTTFGLTSNLAAVSLPTNLQSSRYETEDYGASPDDAPLGEDTLSFDEETLHQSCASGGRLQCQICNIYIADNPSSIGLHARNHLDYKPYHCNLCDYRSPIQAKVRRHLQTVHKVADSTNAWIYKPEPAIRSLVTEMKIRCFPKLASAVESAVEAETNALIANSRLADAARLAVSRIFSSVAGATSSSKEELRALIEHQQQLRQQAEDGDDDDSFVAVDESDAISVDSPQPDDSSSSAAKRGGGLVMDTAGEASIRQRYMVTCELCWENVPLTGTLNNTSQQCVAAHVDMHMNHAHYKCQHCGFVHLKDSVIKEHIRDEHGPESGDGKSGTSLVYMPADPKGNQMVSLRVLK